MHALLCAHVSAVNDTQTRKSMIRTPVAQERNSRAYWHAVHPATLPVLFKYRLRRRQIVTAG